MNTPTTEPIMIFNIRFSLFFHIPSLLKFLFTQGKRPGAAHFTVPFCLPPYSRVESVQRQLERAVSARVIAKGGQCEPGAAGGVSKAGQVLIDGIVPYFHKYVFHAASGARFTLASLGNDAGAYGAFKLALDAFHS